MFIFYHRQSIKMLNFLSIISNHGANCFFLLVLMVSYTHKKFGEDIFLFRLIVNIWSRLLLRRRAGGWIPKIWNSKYIFCFVLFSINNPIKWMESIEKCDLELIWYTPSSKNISNMDFCRKYRYFIVNDP